MYPVIKASDVNQTADLQARCMEQCAIWQHLLCRLYDNASLSLYTSKRKLKTRFWTVSDKSRLPLLRILVILAPSTMIYLLYDCLFRRLTCV